ncbi:MAG: hypothetical protein WA056_05775 [Gallionella sp.]
MDTPTKEDIAKLHAEINIYLTQRITLLISAMSIVGVVLAWVTQKANVQDLSSLGVVFLGGTCLLAFLSVIVLVDLSLEASITFLATYLRQSNVSPWEAAVKIYSHSQKGGVLTIRKIAYGTLGSLATLWPFAISTIAFGQFPTTALLILHLILSGAYFLLLLVLVPVKSKKSAKAIESRWANIFAAQANPTVQGTLRDKKPRSAPDLER